MNLSCDIDSDGTFIDYQERIAISDKEVICCESGVRVPPGQPYAQCHLWWAEGRAHEQADGSYERRDEDLTIYIQCIEIWRLMRSWRRCYGACFPFGAALDMINDGAGDYDPSYRIAKAHFSGTVKAISERYASGRGPRLNKYEKEALEHGRLVSYVPSYDGSDPHIFRSNR